MNETQLPPTRNGEQEPPTQPPTPTVQFGASAMYVLDARVAKYVADAALSVAAVLAAAICATADHDGLAIAMLVFAVLRSFM